MTTTVSAQVERALKVVRSIPSDAHATALYDKYFLRARVGLCAIAPALSLFAGADYGSRHGAPWWLILSVSLVGFVCLAVFLMGILSFGVAHEYMPLLECGDCEDALGLVKSSGAARHIRDAVLALNRQLHVIDYSLMMEAAASESPSKSNDEATDAEREADNQRAWVELHTR